MEPVANSTRAWTDALLEVPSTLFQNANKRSLLADVAAVRCEDFEILEASVRNIDESLDLLAIAVRP